jgi:membrane protease YdiL (CAAX protease family)
MAVRSNAKLGYWLALVLVLATLNYVGRFAGGDTDDGDLLYQWSTAVAGVIQAVVIVGLMLLIARGLPTRSTFAIRRPSSWGTAVGLDLGVFIGILVLSAAVSPFISPGKEQGLVPDQWDPSRAAPFVANAVVIIVLAPVSEELTFRGLGFALLERFGRWSAIALVGFTFALVHGLLEGFPILFAFGAALAFVRARTGSVYPTILLHACFNAVALIGGVAA